MSPPGRSSRRQLLRPALGLGEGELQRLMVEGFAVAGREVRPFDLSHPGLDDGVD